MTTNSFQHSNLATDKASQTGQGCQQECLGFNLTGSQRLERAQIEGSKEMKLSHG